MKKCKFIVYALVLSMCVLFSCGSLPITVNAEGKDVVDSRMTYITSYTTQLSISDTGVATVSGNVRGKASVTSTYVKCTLQMSVGGSWVDVISWEDSSTDNAASIGVDYQLSSRGTYRVYMVCRANTEEKTGTSAYRTY